MSKKATRRPKPGFSPDSACKFWFENRIEPEGWKCILAGGGNYSEHEIGTPIYKTTKKGTELFGYACGETGALLVQVPEN